MRTYLRTYRHTNTDIHYISTTYTTYNIFFQCTFELSTKPRDHFRKDAFGAKFSNPKPWWRHHWFLNATSKWWFSPSYLAEKTTKKTPRSQKSTLAKGKTYYKIHAVHVWVSLRSFLYDILSFFVLGRGGSVPCFRTPKVPQADWQLWSTTITGGFWDATIG